jgi:nitroreductase
MELTDVIRTTNACRYYKPDAVPDELLLKVLDAARWAPTGSNKQPITFLAVRDAAKRRALHDLYQPLWDAILPRYESGEAKAGFKPGFLKHVDHFARHLAEVPVMVVVCADMTQVTALDANLGRLPLTGGSSIYPAVQNLLLAARDVGLGTTLTTILALAEKDVQALLGMPSHVAVAAMITLGWPARPFPARLHRKPLSEFAFLDSYGQALPGAERMD